MWYVIHTISGMEHKCMEQCRRYVKESDYQEIFIPHYIAKKHFRKEWHDVRKILFPGYLFVDTNNMEAIVEGLRKVTQYTKVLKNGESIAPISKEEEKFLSDMMDDEYTVHYSEGFMIGEKVYITQGPLRNYQGRIRTVDRHRRIARLEIPVFGGMTPVEVGFGAVRRVSEEEFFQMKEERIHEEKRQQKKNPESTNELVKVVQGIFQGMTGRLLHKNLVKDEWAVGLEIFGVETKVVFSREEIQGQTMEL